MGLWAASLSQIDPTAFQSLHFGKQQGYDNQSSVQRMGAEMKIGRLKSCKSFICSPNSTLFRLCRLFYHCSSYVRESVLLQRDQESNYVLGSCSKSPRSVVQCSPNFILLWQGLCQLHWGKNKTNEDSFYSSLSFLWVFPVEFIISESVMRWTSWQVSLDDAFKCGRFETENMREKKITTGTHRGVVLNLQILFQFAVFSERIRGGGFSHGYPRMRAETSTSVWEAETLSDTLVLLIIESVYWVGWNAIIAVFVWCGESRQKCCQRQHTEIQEKLSAVVACSLGLRK